MVDTVEVSEALGSCEDYRCDSFFNDVRTTAVLVTCPRSLYQSLS